MTPEVIKELESKEPTEFHKELLTHVMGLMKMSRDAMAAKYDDWDYANEIYKGIRCPDREDEKKNKQGKPVKMVLPINHAQIHSWVSFQFLLLTQNRTFYEMKPTGDEDFKVRPDAELLLDRDVQHQTWPARLYQNLLDTARFGLGILSVSWTEIYAYFLQEQVVEQKKPEMFEGMQVSEGGPTPSASKSDEPHKVLRYMGNRVNNISPFRWFPDPRFPICDFQNGEFCGHEEDYARVALTQLEMDGEIAGIEHLPEMTTQKLAERGATRVGYTRESEQVTGNMRTSGSALSSNGSQTLGVDILSKMEVKIVPSKFKLQDGKPLGKEKWPVLYYVWYANDSRIVKLEPTKTLHGMFGYAQSEYDPDMHTFVNEGLGFIIDKLQATATWFINSHVKGVERTNRNQLIADPAGVDVDALNDNDPIILLKSNASKTGVDRWVKQLQVVDTTSNHMNDVDVLMKLMQFVTGINDNAMGQYNTGRRSATEARAVTSGAASRLKTKGTVIWSTTYVPVGKMMLTNLRAGLNFETFLRVIGRPKPDDVVKLAEMSQRFIEFKGTLEDIVGGDDFFVYDSTLNSEKGFVAQSLQELLQVMLTNPVVSQLLDIDIKALFEEMMYLRGTTNIRRFSLSTNVKAGTTMAPPPPQQQQQLTQGAPTV